MVQPGHTYNQNCSNRPSSSDTGRNNILEKKSNMQLIFLFSKLQRANCCEHVSQLSQVTSLCTPKLSKKIGVCVCRIVRLSDDSVGVPTLLQLTVSMVPCRRWWFRKVAIYHISFGCPKICNIYSYVTLDRARL